MATKKRARAKPASLSKDELARATKLVAFMRRLLAEIDGASSDEGSRRQLLRGLLPWEGRAPYALLEPDYATDKVVRNAVMHCRRALLDKPRAARLLAATLHDLVSRGYVTAGDTRSAAQMWRSDPGELETHVAKHVVRRRGTPSGNKRAIEVMANLTGRDTKTIGAAFKREDPTQLVSGILRPQSSQGGTADHSRARVHDSELRARITEAVRGGG